MESKGAQSRARSAAADLPLPFFRALAGLFRAHAGQACLACGICCELYGGVLSACAEDVERWRSEGRQDLLARVRPDGAIWVDPGATDRLETCPYLRRTGADAATCAIHRTKPKICRDYPTPVHGSRCPRGIRFPPSAPGKP